MPSQASAKRLKLILDEVEIVETHLHTYERWFETAAVPNAEIHVADRIGSGLGAFVIDGGNDTWGAWVQILGSSDTPATTGKLKYDLHRLMVTDIEKGLSAYFVQIGFGTSGAAALTAGTYTEVPLIAPAVNVGFNPVTIQHRRQDVGTKAWARCMADGANTGTMDFMFGIHEYDE